MLKNDESGLSNSAHMNSLKDTLYQALTIFFKLFTRKKHILWLMKLKNGYFFNNYVMKPFYVFDVIGLRAMRGGSLPLLLPLRMLCFHGALKYGLSHKDQILASFIKKKE